MKSLLGKKASKVFIFSIFFFATSLTFLQGQVQQKHSIKGQIMDQQNMQAMAFATVALRKATDSTLITGTATNLEGEFSLESLNDGQYCLIISAIGYTSVTKNIDLKDNYNTGIILIKEKSLTLGEVVVVGERMKAKAEPDKTTYFMNKKMYDASTNGVEILSYIPGVQVDIMKNISLEGSQHIIILVDGKERDRNFLSQLNSNQIDKVEIINTPDSRYDADVTGVINVILKKERESGINGQVHMEIPTSQSAIYIFPNYNFNYGFKKFNLYTSYDGNLSYFNITENSYRNFQDGEGLTDINSTQIVRQKYWSHRFQYGFDYILNDKNQINFYGYYNPYSSEHNGNVDMQVTGDKFGYEEWSALKQDRDINRSSLYSVYYKHLFDKPGREISLELTYFNFNAENATSYITTFSTPENFMTNQVNSVKPEQNSLSCKIDYSSPIAKKLKFNAGVKIRYQLLQDRQTDEFKYNENIFALYGTLAYNFSKFNLNAGIRAEKSTTGLTDSFSNNVFALLPNVIINYKINQTQNIKLSYSRSLSRPNIYELNPYTSVDDPYTTESGNPYLKPEYQRYLSVDYSKNIGNNYITLRLFYTDRSDAISHYTFVNDTGIFETDVANLGNLHGYGIQLTGALKINKAIAINPYLKLTEIYTEVNSLAMKYDISNRHKPAFESGISAIVTFKYDFIASLQFQYSSPLIDFQNLSFSDAS